MDQRRKRERSEFLQQSREAGKRTFDKFSHYLSYRLYSLSQLRTAEHPRQKMIDFTGTDAEHWEEAGEYDRKSYVQGFFQRACEVSEEMEVRLSE